MPFRRALRPLHALLAAATVAALFGAASPAAAAPWAGNRGTFAAPRFEAVWRTADLPVQQGATGRSWTWGPTPWFDYHEPYKQAPNGLRLVQYFDKARMEINDPANTSGPLGGVTNGLLVVELVSGRVKLGNGIGLDENRQWREADIPVAGDPSAGGNVNPTTPTYTSFRAIATTDNGYRDPNKVGQRVVATLARDGTRGVRQDLGAVNGADILRYEPVTGHNIPGVFEDFLNAGSVPWIAAFGYPISDPYWITARVGGQDKDVMVQLFERRALTYTPSNSPAFRVEMGNVGQHYFHWRYGLGEPWNNPDPRDLPIVFSSKRDYPEFTTYIMDQTGANQRLGHTGWGRSIPYSFRGYYHPFVQIPQIYGYTASTSPEEHNGKRRIASWQAEDARTSFYSESRFNDWDPAISPDGNQIIFASDRDGNADLYLVTLPIYSHNGSQGASGEQRLNISPVTQTTGCSNTHPSWLPNGTGIVYESTCHEGGKSQIYRANLGYTLGPDAGVRIAQPVTGRRLAATAADDYWPRVSPDGSRIAFFSNRDGNTEIYTMNIDGGDHRRLTTNAARDEGPVWSPDGSKIAFNSNRDGDHEIFVMNADGGGQAQLTNNTVDDGFAVWGP